MNADPKTPTPPMFVSLTQARARRDHIAAAILGELKEIHPKDAAEMIENICCAGKGWRDDANKVEAIFEKSEICDAPEVRVLEKVVQWIRDEERRQLDAALAGGSK